MAERGTLPKGLQQIESFDYEKERLKIKMCTHPYMIASTIRESQKVLLTKYLSYTQINCLASSVLMLALAYRNVWSRCGTRGVGVICFFVHGHA